MNQVFWTNKRVLVTGHTGFKGAWLCLWLQALGADVKGYALESPTEPALFAITDTARFMESEIGDIRNLEQLQKSVSDFRPEIVVHMAAQALVRASYSDPIGTYSTNVIGTAHLLEAVRHVDSVRAVICVTSDKCYENDGRSAGLKESDPMGGHDPYSSSKGCAELVAAAYRRSFFSDTGSPGIASARAGNVIGGGDWSKDRLVPDILRSFETGATVAIRNPHATRPWQHVLEPLSGYLVLAEALHEHGQEYAEGWNFGPASSDNWPVQRVVERMAEMWGEGASWSADRGDHPDEAAYLSLDCAQARDRLNWLPRWDLDAALRRTVGWHRAWLDGQDMIAVCGDDISSYMAATQGAPS